MFVCFGQTPYQIFKEKLPQRQKEEVNMFIFTVIVLNNAPIINGYVGDGWKDESCQKYVDLHKYIKDKTPAQLSMSQKDKDKWPKMKLIHH